MEHRLDYAQQSPQLLQHVSKLSQAIHEISLETALLELVEVRASQMNGCAFCLDMHVKEARIHGERELRLHHLAVWRESPLFSERERAALEWAEAVTDVGKSGVPNELYERMKTVFSDQELTELTLVVNMINFWNRLCVAFRSEPGSADRMYGLDRAGLH